MHQTTEVYHPIDPPVHLDILSSKPLDPSHPQPTLVYFHGGGLTAGSRHVQAQALLPQLLLAEGWAIVCPDYRLLPESGIPEILQDLHELEKWLLQCKAGIDVSRLVMAGSSAGAFVSLLALTSWQSVKPRAFYSQYGMVDTAGEWYRRRKDDTTVFGNIPASALVEDMFTQYFQPGRLQITADALAVLVPDSRGGLVLVDVERRYGERDILLFGRTSSYMPINVFARSVGAIYQQVYESCHRC
ncbi:hypothetical protein N7470_003924 [Penicillium chermesinum]|nr:hypothetical protein N7470_003924 [Penicillium chermesinum]